MKNVFNTCLLILLTSLFFSCGVQPQDCVVLIDAESLATSDPDSASILLESIKHPNHLNKKQQATFFLLQTEVKDRTEKDISKDDLLKAIDYFKKGKDYNKLAYAYFYQNRIFMSLNQIEQAIVYCCLSKEQAEKIGDLYLLGLIYHDLGSLYKEQFNFKEALDNSKRSLKYFLQIGNRSRAIRLYKTIGDIYLINNQKNDIDSALVYYQKVLEYTKYENNPKDFYNIYLSISLNLCESKLFEDAKVFGERAIILSKDVSENFNNYISLSDIYLKLNCPDSALIFLNKALSSNSNLNFTETYIYKKMQYRIYRMKKSHKLALWNLEDCVEYQDSVFKNTVQQKILEVQSKYEKESIENERNELLIERLYYVIFSLFFALVTPCIIIFFKYKNKKQKFELLKTQQNLNLLVGMLQTQNNNEDKLRQLFAEKLDIVRKIAQMGSTSNLSSNLFIKQYYNVFGHNIAENMDWDKNLYEIFNGLYNNFVYKLKNTYPSLTEKELQLCCLIKANFSKDEICLILSYESNSIKTIRSRICKKMGFDNSDDFTNYIANL